MSEPVKDVCEELREQIKSLERQEAGLLSASRVLRELYEQKEAPMYKNRSSAAIDEAQQYRDKINELKKKMKELGCKEPEQGDQP